MKPIDDRADVAYMEALRCVGFRVPALQGMNPASYAVALGLRYGLVGISASHHLLLNSEPGDESAVFGFIRSWPLMVEEHLRSDLAQRLPLAASEDLFITVSHLAHQPLRQYLGMWRQGVPLERCLSIVADRFVQQHEGQKRKPWFRMGRRKQTDRFRVEAENSLLFAMHFFERREAGLEEVSAIALLGE